MSVAPIALGPVMLSPALSWPVMAILGAGLLVLAAFGLWRRARGNGWRAAAMAALFAAGLNPTLIQEQRTPLSDIAVVVTDTTASQRIGGRLAETARAAAELETRLKAQDGLEVRRLEVGEKDADGASGTRLFTALDRLLGQIDSRRLAGVILITDGQVHDVPEALPSALRAPVHVLLTGDPDGFDRRVVVEEAPRYGIVGKPLTLTFRVEDDAAQKDDTVRRPATPAPMARVAVRLSGETVFDQPVQLGVPVTVPFEIGHAGKSIIEIEAAPRKGEVSALNNRVVLAVNGIRDRLQVLLISGEPHAGERVWRNLLKADPAVDLVHFTILRTPQEANLTPVDELSLIAFPTRELFEEKLKDFDLIILDRYRRRGVLPLRYFANLAGFVEEGGALLIAAGPEFAGARSLYDTPLAQILPARPTRRVFEQGFRPVLSAAGQRHPVTADLPDPRGAGQQGWGRWFRQIEAIALRGEVLMRGVNRRPLLVLDRVGEGRVAELLSDQAWLWARGFEGGGPQAELLRRLAHWLMKEPDLEENALEARVSGDRITVVQRTMDETPLPVRMTGPDGTEVPVAMSRQRDGAYAATVSAGVPGLYRFSDGRHQAFAVAGAVDAREFTDIQPTPERLAPVTAASGGGIVWLARAGVPEIRRVKPGQRTAGRNWIGLYENGEARITGVRRTALLPAWVLLLLITAPLLMAWYREGR